MKSKLTLRLDEDLKERAKRLAERRGTSVSKIVEHYFKLLLQEDPVEASGSEASGSEASGSEASGETHESEGRAPTEGPLGTARNEVGLSERMRRLKEKLGKPAPEIDMDEDTRRWVDAAAQKHA